MNYTIVYSKEAHEVVAIQRIYKGVPCRAELKIAAYGERQISQIYSNLSNLYR